MYEFFESLLVNYEGSTHALNKICEVYYTL